MTNLQQIIKEREQTIAKYINGELTIRQTRQNLDKLLGAELVNKFDI